MPKTVRLYRVLKEPRKSWNANVTALKPEKRKDAISRQVYTDLEIPDLLAPEQPPKPGEGNL
jgi:hypothetical protein